MDVKSLLKNFALSPDLYSVTTRQAEKLTKRLARINPDPIAALEMAWEVGEQRALRAGPTLYMSSIGSSGSH